MKVIDCPDCSTPLVEVFEEVTGFNRFLELRAVVGGAYEVVGDGLMRHRTTAKTGKRTTSGKGMRIHECPAATLKRQQDIAAGVVASSINRHGERVPQTIVKTPPRPPAPVAAVIIELQDTLGVDQLNYDGGPTGYIEWTGKLGPGTCGKCGADIIACAHPTRPSGERPILLHAAQHHEGPWRAFLKTSVGPDTPFAQFYGHKSKDANRYNHRVICPGAHT